MGQSMENGQTRPPDPEKKTREMRATKRGWSNKKKRGKGEREREPRERKKLIIQYARGVQTN